MKKANYYFVLITTFLVLACSGCIFNGSYHAAGTMIGVEAGAPNAGSLTIGYRDYRATAISDAASANISTTTGAGMSGLETTTTTIINGSDDITVNESRGHDGSTDTTG